MHIIEFLSHQKSLKWEDNSDGIAEGTTPPKKRPPLTLLEKFLSHEKLFRGKIPHTLMEEHHVDQLFFDDCS